MFPFVFHIVAQGATAGNFLDYLSRASIITFLIVVVYGGYKQWWVWGWLYNDKSEECSTLREEKDAWRDIALRGANIATQAFEEFSKRQP